MITTFSNTQQNTPIRFDTATIAVNRVKILVRQAGPSADFKHLNILMPILTALLATGSDVNVSKSLDLRIIMSVHGASVSLLTISGIAPLTTNLRNNLLHYTGKKDPDNTVVCLKTLFESYIMHRTDNNGDAPTFKITLGDQSDCYFVGYLTDMHCSTSQISPLLLNYLLKFLGLMKSRK